MSTCGHKFGGEEHPGILPFVQLSISGAEESCGSCGVGGEASPSGVWIDGSTPSGREILVQAAALWVILEPLLLG